MTETKAKHTPGPARDEDLLAAAEWLDLYEDIPGDPGERDGMLRVSAFLRREVENRMVRAVAREKGVPASVVRAAIAKAEG